MAGNGNLTNHSNQNAAINGSHHNLVANQNPRLLLSEHLVVNILRQYKTNFPANFVCIIISIFLKHLNTTLWYNFCLQIKKAILQT